MRPLLVDPSGRGGIARYTRRLAGALCAVGASPTLVACRSVEDGGGPYRTMRWLPRQRWGRPPRVRAWPGFYAGRAGAWLATTAAVEASVYAVRPEVVHFQAPISRRFDAALVRRIRRRAPVVWTAHDVLPPEPAPADRDRFASLYRTVDLVVVHGQTAADEVRRLAGVEAAIVEHVPDDTVPLDRAEARRRLGLPAGERVLGAFGFIRPYKGYELLADVWERLGPAAPLLLVVGELVDDGGHHVLERLERSGRAIVRSGYASDTELQLAASATDAILLPHIQASESGLLHLGRAVGAPILASDAPQLAASVRASKAGAVLPRSVEVWAAAVTGPLPPAPAPPPPPETVGAAHVAIYEEALRRARA